jgi:C_GCAxxG_C_C family probable redox protein
MTKSEDAVKIFSEGITCSASVFSVFAGDLELDERTARKIACGFGGGLSKTGNICGAVSGAIMVIGLKYGKADAGDDDATAKTRALTRQFMQEFTTLNGSVNCTDLLGYNLSIPEEYQAAAGANLFKTRCPAYVRDAVEILEKIL